MTAVEQETLNMQFIIAAMNDDADQVVALLQGGAQIDAISEEGDGQSLGHETALHFAALYNADEMVKLLLSYKPSLEIRNNSGMTPLIVSAMVTKSPKISKMLLDQHADVCAVDSSGETALHWAAKNGFDRALVDQLILAGAEVDAVSNAGQMPLEIAVRQLRVAPVRALLENGASVTTTSFMSAKLIDLMKQSNLAFQADSSANIVSLLIDFGADPLAPDISGKTVRDRFPDSPRVQAMVAAVEAKKSISSVLLNVHHRSLRPA